MKIELNINDDKELRAFIKDMVKWVVKSVIREDIQEILKEVTQKKIEDKNITNIDFIIRDEVNKMVRADLWVWTLWLDGMSFIRMEAKKLMSEYIKKAFEKWDAI